MENSAEREVLAPMFGPTARVASIFTFISISGFTAREMLVSVPDAHAKTLNSVLAWASGTETREIPQVPGYPSERVGGVTETTNYAGGEGSTPPSNPS